LTALQARGQLRAPSVAIAARLLVSLAHDWALGAVFVDKNTPHRERELREMVDTLWEGLRN
jgi:hypothetical protein